MLIADAIIKAASETAQGGVTSYLHPRPGRTEPVRKTVFARKFAPWNVTISYGLYVDDIDADVRALTVDLGMVLAAASNLSKQAEQLSGEVGTFLKGVRAA
ncbi:cache domain-containing protein [Bradyrhizobium sp. STM 3561]|uniref:cache domain-containing protein n=1 Tax=Bradyrhizobium sp. STM 3561 TaxID=578923 RepID=UPI0038910B47